MRRLIAGFGMFWLGEGGGLHCPGQDLALVRLAAIILAVSLLITAWLRSSRNHRVPVIAG